MSRHTAVQLARFLIIRLVASTERRSVNPTRDTVYLRGSDRSTSRANTADPYGIAASLKL